MPAPIIGQPKPPPGWYPDQQSSSALRWWDGQQWTSYQAPLQGNASSFPQASLANPYPITNHHSTHAQEQVDFHHLLSDEPTVRAAVAGQVHAPNGRQGPWLVIAGLISVFFLVFFLVGTTTGVLNAIGLPSRGDGFVRLGRQSADVSGSCLLSVSVIQSVLRTPPERDSRKLATASQGDEGRGRVSSCRHAWIHHVSPGSVQSRPDFDWP
ncbi:DUF2510 domain-containing protein [Micrococcus luteus]|uniref:DUF2510 domain-containing protein n=1 Tax=Micrococcus luteus TaxID=1270 RepID=UPI003829DF1B